MADSLPTVDRPIPTDYDAEMSVIGDMLNSTEKVLPVVVPMLGDGAAFFCPDLRVAYNVVAEMFEKNMPVDLVTMSHEMKGMPRPVGKQGWEELLIDCAQTTPTVLNAEHHASIVLENYVKREAARLCFACATGLCESKLDDAHEYIREYADKILATLEHQADRSDTKNFLDSQDELRAEKRNPVRAAVITGISRIDHQIDGIRRGQVCVVAARPSIGKSSLALSIAYNVGNAGGNVLFFTVEMPAFDILMRLMSLNTGQPASEIMGDNMGNEEFDHVCELMAMKDSAKNIRFNDSVRSVDQLINVASVISMRQRVDLIVVDYLQLLDNKKSHGSREREVADMSKRLKHLARSTNTAMLLVSQLNRGPAGRENGRPAMHELRESGAIEQDADQVWMMWRDDGDLSGSVRWFVCKNRNGRAGDDTTECLNFHNASMRF